MAQSDPVRVTVEILDEFSDDLAELNAELEKIDNKSLTVDLEISDDGDIEEVKATLKSLEEKLNTELDIDLDNYASTEAALKALARDRNVKIDPEMGKLGGADSYGPPTAAPGFSDNEKHVLNRQFINPSVSRAVPDDVNMGTSRFMFGVDQDLGRRQAPGFSLPRGGTRVGGSGFDISKDGFDIPILPGFDSLGENDPMGGILKKVKSAFPKVRTWMNLLAAIIPMLIALAGAALGAAAALGGLAVAGGAIVGLGALGYGENARESMEILQDKIGEVKKELFSTFKPAFQAMNPIFDEWLSGLSNTLKSLVGPLQRLAAYEGFLEGVGGGLVNWLRGLLVAIADLRPKIEAIAGRIGAALTGNNVMEGLVNEVLKNMEAFGNLAKILGYLILILYEVSKAFSLALAPLAPLAKMVLGLARLLNNRFVRGLITAAASVVILYGALSILTKVLGVMTVTALWNTIGAVIALIAKMLFMANFVLTSVFSGLITMAGGLYTVATAAWSAFAAMSALAKVATIATLGGAALIGGWAISQSNIMSGGGGKPASSGGSYGGYDSGGGGGGATVNIYGDVGNSEYQKMKDNFGQMYDEKAEVNDETEK